MKLNLYPLGICTTTLGWDGVNSAVKQTPVSCPLYVDWFGAVGDGTADDTAAIAACLTAAGPNSEVIFSSGKGYKTTSAITIPYDHMTLRGDNSIITSDVETHAQKFIFSGRAGGRVTGLNFYCLYSSASTSFSPGIVTISASSDIVVDHCVFSGTPYAGVYLVGNCQRTVITDNLFGTFFVGIFSDDDGALYQPTRTLISNNVFRLGIGTTTTNFSGAIKFSGIGSATSVCGHVISGNQIDTCGQMGIEIQTWINDTAITGNTVIGTGFGISVSGCARVAVDGNTVRNCDQVGVETASGAINVAITGNTISSSANTGDGMSINSSSTKITISGNTVEKFDNNINIDTSSIVTVSGNQLGLPTGSTVVVKNSTDVNITGNTMAVNGSSYQFITLDSTDASVKRVNISGNIWTGSPSNNGITLYQTAHTIEDVMCYGNNVKGASCPGGMWYDGAAATPITGLLRIRSFNNYGDAWANTTVNLNLATWSLSANKAFFYGYYYMEGTIVSMDASGGARTFELPEAVGLNGYEIAIQKNDSSGNTVTISGYNSRTINGASTLVLSSQWSLARLRSDSSNWIIVSIAP